MDAVTDTHSPIWYLEDDPSLSPNASQVFDDCDVGLGVVYIPTICLVEIVYLQEKGRIPADLRARVDARLQSGTHGSVIIDLTAAIVDATAQVPRNQVPDMPDRIIAWTAVHLGVPVISKDGKIQLAAVPTIW